MTAGRVVHGTALCSNRLLDVDNFAETSKAVLKNAAELIEICRHVGMIMRRELNSPTLRGKRDLEVLQVSKNVIASL